MQKNSLPRAPAQPEKHEARDDADAKTVARLTQPRAADASGTKPKTPAKSLVSVCAADVEPQGIDWIWPGRLARGKHTAITGDPGLGKSQMTIDIAARVTTGRPWPCGDGSQRAPASVIVLSAEDDPADTIVPRLLAAEADLSRVHIVTGVRDPSGLRMVSLQADLDVLSSMIDSIGDVALVIVDPISSYLGGRSDSKIIDTHKNAEVRSVLEPLGAFAERHRVAVLSVTHVPKGPVGKAVHAFVGSIAFVGAPRAAFVVLRDRDDPDRRLLLTAKCNLGPEPPGLAFRVRGETVGDSITTSCIEWEADAVNLTADQVLASQQAPVPDRLDEAKEWLVKVLINGSVPAKDIERQARADGIALATLRRAKEALKVLSRKEIDGWSWRLPMNNLNLLSSRQARAHSV